MSTEKTRFSDAELQEFKELIQTKLKEAAGLTADEAAKLAEYEQLTGKSSEDVYNNIGKTNKGVLSQKKINSPNVLGKRRNRSSLVWWQLLATFPCQ